MPLDHHVTRHEVQGWSTRMQMRMQKVASAASATWLDSERLPLQLLPVLANQGPIVFRLER